MKSFSLAWKSSSKASKQRKYRLNSPLHLKRKLIAAHAAPELSARYNITSVLLRKGDTVKIVKGDLRGTTGKVNNVNIRKGFIYVDGAERVRKDGTKSFRPLQPSNLIALELDVEDKQRLASLTKNVKGAAAPEKKTAKAPAAQKQPVQKQTKG